MATLYRRTYLSVCVATFARRWILKAAVHALASVSTAVLEPAGWLANRCELAACAGQAVVSLIGRLKASRQDYHNRVWLTFPCIIQPRASKEA